MLSEAGAAATTSVPSALMPGLSIREVEQMPVPSPDLTGVLFGTLLVTMALTPILSLLMLRGYRRALRRSMYATGPGSLQSADQAGMSERHGSPDPGPGGLPFAPVVAIAGSPVRASGGDGAGWPLARRRMRSLCYVYVAAGVAYGLVAAIVWLLAGQMELRRLAIVAVLFAWPAVAMVHAVLAARRRIGALMWAGYLALVLILSAGTGVDFDEILLLIVLIVAQPGLLLLALSGLNSRTLSPFLAVPVLIAVAGSLIWSSLALPLVQAGASLALATAVAIVPVLVFLSTAVAYFWWSARQYARKRVSDQMLLSWQWLFLVTVCGSLLLLSAGPGGPWHSGSPTWASG